MVSIIFNLNCYKNSCFLSTAATVLIVLGVIFTLIGQYVPSWTSDFVEEAKIIGPCMIAGGIVLFLLSYVSCGRPDIYCCKNGCKGNCPENCCEKGCAGCLDKLKSCFPDLTCCREKLSSVNCVDCKETLSKVNCCQNGLPQLPQLDSSKSLLPTTGSPSPTGMPTMPGAEHCKTPPPPRRPGVDHCKSPTPRRPGVDHCKTPPPKRHGVDYCKTPPPPRHPGVDHCKTPPPKRHGVDQCKPPPPRPPPPRTWEAKNSNQATFV